MAKPRLWFDGTLWWCEDAETRCSGLTAKQAYERFVARLWVQAHPGFMDV